MGRVYLSTSESFYRATACVLWSCLAPRHLQPSPGQLWRRGVPKPRETNRAKALLRHLQRGEGHKDASKLMWSQTYLPKKVLKDEGSLRQPIGEAIKAGPTALRHPIEEAIKAGPTALFFVAVHSSGLLETSMEEARPQSRL